MDPEKTARHRRLFCVAARFLTIIFFTFLSTACGDATGSSSDEITIETNSLDDGWETVGYSVQLSASGGSAGQYGWSLGGGALPDGIVLDGEGRLDMPAPGRLVIMRAH
jgi:hypothetical protein